MTWPGVFIVFESASKCGKTTLARMLKEELEMRGSHQVIANRGALSRSSFTAKISKPLLNDIGYSSAFYWADVLFNTRDNILPGLQARECVVIQDRYDLSIVAYHEIHGLWDDEMLLDEFLSRNMVVHPDLTVFLQPDPDVALQRIRSSEDSTAVDVQFVYHPENLARMQERFLHHLIRLKRNFLVLDTGVKTPQECLAEILRKIPHKE